MQSVAESWLVYRLTGSSAMLGVAAFASQAPVLLFATIGGAVADRIDRHRIIVITQTVSMILPLTLAALTLTGYVRVWHVLTLAACLGVVSLAGMPYAVLMPIFAVQILRGGPRALGRLMGATGFGALCGALSLAMRSGVRGLGRLVPTAAAAFGVSLVLFSLSRRFWLS